MSADFVVFNGPIDDGIQAFISLPFVDGKLNAVGAMLASSEFKTPLQLHDNEFAIMAYNNDEFEMINVGVADKNIIEHTFDELVDLIDAHVKSTGIIVTPADLSDLHEGIIEIDPDLFF